LSANGAKAKIDTLPSIVEAYKQAVNAMDEAFVYSATDKLSIETVNNAAAPVFVIFPDGAMTDEEALDLLEESGLKEVVDHSASKAFVARPANGTTFTEEDVATFKTIVGKIAVTSNFKLIGVGNGATFINQNLTDYTNFVSGLALINPEEGNAVKSPVPTYLVTDNEAVVDAYVAANSAQEVEEGFYQNPNSRFEIVKVNTNTSMSAAEAIADGWEEVLDLYGRIGNHSEVYKETATWYSRPLLTGDDAYDQARKYQFYDSIEAIENTKRYVCTEDLNGSGTLSLWYEYIPESASTKEGTVPMVVLMHGNTNDPRTQYDTSGWAQVAEKYGIILVCPEWQGHTYQGYTYEPMTADSNATPKSDMI
ncbi:MAG: hypothetical protein HUJ56_06350, partial [Erysipelotrichaceae bacterium]|nr:hypothetical protein [Erysipelotrichaceae bacterium]